MFSLAIWLTLKMTFVAVTAAAALTAVVIMVPASSVINIFFLLILSFNYLLFFLSLYAL